MSKTVIEKKEFDFKAIAITVCAVPMGYAIYNALKKKIEEKRKGG